MQIKPLESPEELRGAILANRSAWKAAYRGILPDAFLDDIPPDVSDETIEGWYDRIQEESVFLLAIDETAIGYIYVRWGTGTKEFVGSNEADLKELYVHPDWWGQGVGTRLLERAIDSLPAWLDAITLEMLAGNGLADQFYRARGFDRIGTNEFSIEGTDYPTCVYSRSL